IFRDLSLDVLATADLALLAAAYLALDNLDLARLYAEEALTLLDACRGEGPDYPQRDYFFCYQVMQAAGEPKKASHALAEAHRLLQQQAQTISPAAMQRSFLYNVAGNRTILSEWSARHPLLS